MATNPLGRGTKTIGINMNADMAYDIEARARAMQLSTSAYCKIIFEQWLEQGGRLCLEEDVRDEEPLNVTRTDDLLEENSSGTPNNVQVDPPFDDVMKSEEPVVGSVIEITESNLGKKSKQSTALAWCLALCIIAIIFIALLFV